VARIVAFIPDLLFGSRVVAALTAEGHQVELVASPPDPVRADVLIVDLTADANERIAAFVKLDRGPVRALAFYSHVENDVRERAQSAGFDLVVPRSRMAREGPELVGGLAGSG